MIVGQSSDLITSCPPTSYTAATSWLGNDDVALGAIEDEAKSVRDFVLPPVLRQGFVDLLAHAKSLRVAVVVGMHLSEDDVPYVTAVCGRMAQASASSIASLTTLAALTGVERRKRARIIARGA